MMKLLIILLLVSGYTFADYKTVKDIKGIKIPKGISARYDTLEDQYCIRIIDARTFHFPLEIRIKNTGKGFYPVVDINYLASSWLWVENSTIYIENENQDLLKFSYNWENRLTDIDRGIREYIYSLDGKLFKFLSDNISNSYRTHKLSKGDVKRLYKELTKQ